MCLIVFAYQVHEEFPFILAANRDEYYARATQDCHWWPEDPNLLAGRDEVAGGTWLGVHKQGRFAALTNFREGEGKNPDHISRGELTKSFLMNDVSAEEYMGVLQSKADQYAGFNLLIADPTGLYYFSNRSGETWQKLKPGIYGLSNDLLDSPWPKLVTSRDAFTKLIENKASPQPDHLSLIKLMHNEAEVPESELPQTGVSPKMEAGLAKIFIHMDWKGYGTRATSSLWCQKDGEVHFAEQKYALSSDNKNVKAGFQQLSFENLLFTSKT